MTATATRLVDPALFASGTDVRLRGSTCTGCTATTFPAEDSCPRCGCVAMTVVALPPAGTIWSFTVQHFEPKSPYRGDGEFAPYGVGYVDLGAVIVEARLVEADPASMRIGDQVALCLVPAFTDPDGTRVLTFAFGPQAGGSQR
jgi:uncharacterized OB-fold protein